MRLFMAKKRPIKCEKFLCQTMLWRGGFPKLGKINSSSSLYELKKPVNLPSSLMSRRTLRIWLVFCHMLDTFTITTFTRIFCKPLHGSTTGMEIFQKVNEFFTEVGLFWTDCFGVCTDGAAAMT